MSDLDLIDLTIAAKLLQKTERELLQMAAFGNMELLIVYVDWLVDEHGNETDENFRCVPALNTMEAGKLFSDGKVSISTIKLLQRKPGLIDGTMADDVLCKIPMGKDNWSYKKSLQTTEKIITPQDVYIDRSRILDGVITLPAGATHIQFDDMPHLIAFALYPEPHDEVRKMNYAGARINLKNELEIAARGGILPVKNALDMGSHTLPLGAALEKSRVKLDDLRNYLKQTARDIEVVIAHPDEKEQIAARQASGFFTLEEAADVISKQECFADGTQKTLLKQMIDAARDGELIVRDPNTHIPYRPTKIRYFWEVVHPRDINRWLRSIDAGYSWKWPEGAHKKSVAYFEGDVGWWDEAMDAKLWFSLGDISPKDAAALLCCLNPNEQGDPLISASDETAPADYKRLLTVFEDVSRTHPMQRTLRDWQKKAVTDGLKYHSWIKAYAAAAQATGSWNAIQPIESQKQPKIVLPLGTPYLTLREIPALTSRAEDNEEKIAAPNPPLTKKQVINAFEDIHFSRQQWSRALANGRQWIMPCRVTPGKKGSRFSATWNPVLIASALLDKEVKINKLDAVFVDLKDWAEEWREKSALFRN